jgi:hypothetical protein
MAILFNYLNYKENDYTWAVKEYRNFLYYHPDLTEVTVIRTSEFLFLPISDLYKILACKVMFDNACKKKSI